MARIYSPLGTIKGSVGNLTFSGGAGDNQIRQKIASNGSKTPAQVEVRSRFKLLASLFTGLAMGIRAGLKRQGNQSPYNRFMGINYNATSLDAQGNASVDYSKLSISGGSVEPLAGVGAVLDAVAGKVMVSFADNSNGNTALDTDMVKAVVLHKQTGRVISQSDEDVTRGDGSVELEDDALLGAQAADLVAYAFATRADGSDASATRTAQVG